VWNPKKRVLFSDSLPLSQDQFLKVGFFDSFNGLRYLRWGGDGEAVQPEKG